jgi:hypothetical protein
MSQNNRTHGPSGISIWNEIPPCNNPIMTFKPPPLKRFRTSRRHSMLPWKISSHCDKPFVTISATYTYPSFPADPS